MTEYDDIMREGLGREETAGLARLGFRLEPTGRGTSGLVRR